MPRRRPRSRSGQDTGRQPPTALASWGESREWQQWPLPSPAEAIPGFLCDLRRRLEAVAAPASRPELLSVVQELPYRGAPTMLHDLALRGCDVSLLAVDPQARFFSWQVHAAFEGFVTTPPEGDAVLVANYLACVAAWLKYLRRPWSELLVFSLQNYAGQDGTLDAQLQPRPYGFDLSAFAWTASLGAARAAELDAVNLDSFVGSLRRLCCRLAERGRPTAMESPQVALVGCRWAVQHCGLCGADIDATMLFADLSTLARTAQPLRRDVEAVIELAVQKLRVKSVPAEIVEALHAPDGGDRYTETCAVALSPLDLTAAPWPW